MKPFKICLLGLLLIVAALTTVTAQSSPGQEQLHSKVVEVSSAEILTSNADPVVLVSAPNASYFIQVVSAVVDFEYSGTAYATNTTANLGYGDGTVLLKDSISLAVTADQVTSLNGAVNGTRANTKGQDLVLKTATGNPTAGTGTMKIYVQYRLINLSSGGY